MLYTILNFPSQPQSIPVACVHSPVHQFSSSMAQRPGPVHGLLPPCSHYPLIHNLVSHDWSPTVVPRPRQLANINMIKTAGEQEGWPTLHVLVDRFCTITAFLFLMFDCSSCTRALPGTSSIHRHRLHDKTPLRSLCRHVSPVHVLPCSVISHLEYDKRIAFS